MTGLHCNISVGKAILHKYWPLLDFTISEMNGYLAVGFFLHKNILTQMCSFYDLKRKKKDLLDVKYSSE